MTPDDAKYYWAFDEDERRDGDLDGEGDFDRELMAELVSELQREAAHAEANP